MEKRRPVSVKKLSDLHGREVEREKEGMGVRSGEEGC